MGKTKSAFIWFVVGVIFAVLVEGISDKAEGVIAALLLPLRYIDVIVILNGGRFLSDFGGIVHLLTFPLTFGVFLLTLSLALDFKAEKDLANNKQPKERIPKNKELKKMRVIGSIILLIILLFGLLPNAQSFQETMTKNSLEAQARSGKNCERLPDVKSQYGTTYRDICYHNSGECEKILSLDQKNICYHRRAVNAQDKNLCNVISNQEKIQWCYEAVERQIDYKANGGI
ncbi:MAG: hypothetical protein Q7S65_04815 [Nanoarchaeota archaeon]|nr:hypothetical protein [Nanoarchaeota archaeon]